MDESTDAILKDCGHQLLECRGCVAITHLHYLASEHAKYCGECHLMDVFQYNVYLFVHLRVSYWGHKISKSTSVDCNKIYVVTVKVRKIVGISGKFPHYSYTVGPYGKGPTSDYTTCTYSS